MRFKSRIFLSLSLSTSLLLIIAISAPEINAVVTNANLKMLARWCCVNQRELTKCGDWKTALNSTNTSTVLLDCVSATDKYDCFKKIFEDEADLMVADAGDVYTAGKYYNLVPISSEVYSSGSNMAPHSDFYAVAIVKRTSTLTMETLRGANSCHGGVGTSAGWNMPISTLIEKKLLEIVDCNNHVKAATQFFNKMCAPDALNNQFNPTGDNPTSTCDLCKGRIGSTFCTNQDPYAGNIGAMYCLIDGGGDVAFVKHTTMQELVSANKSINAQDFELLCPNRANEANGYQRAPISDYMNCNWGKSPGRAVLTSGRKALQQKRDYKAFLRQSAKLFGGRPIAGVNSSMFFATPATTTTTAFFNIQPRTEAPWWALPTNFSSGSSVVNSQLPIFYLFDSSAYGSRDLLFLDQTVSFLDSDDGTTYSSYLDAKSSSYLSKILKLYECPLRLIRWCVVSNYEKDKCRLMKNAFASRNIKPDLDCVSGKNAFECMSMVKNRLADLLTVDPGDAYRATRYYGLQPLAAEDYGTGTEKPIYYAVAVVKKTDLTTNLWNMRSKRMCGTAIGDMAGWHVPVDYLIGIKELYLDKCRIGKIVGEYFGRSCVPGAMDYDYNTLNTNPRALCLACYSKGADYCSRSQREIFYGDTGAFHCINEGRGDVAFVRHTSVKANTDGRNTDQWARPLRQTDFELLCKDGTRKSVEKYEECNMMKVPSRVVMIAGHRTEIQRSYLWNMLNFAQQLFGSDTNPDFTMFESMKEHPDLIFMDATVQLVEVQSSIEDYLGNDLIAMLHRTDDRICNAANQLAGLSIALLGLVTFMVSLLNFMH